ncbi:MAG: hypothetical protein A4E23_00111 [Methanomethylovorans sp. PtaU1.Bin073]|nr:MAG: hypothetical protein A4E23_00111 [Methanomethylovorans sp. PtaU1.Bin073]
MHICKAHSFAIEVEIAVIATISFPYFSGDGNLVSIYRHLPISVVELDGYLCKIRFFSLITIIYKISKLLSPKGA